MQQTIQIAKSSETIRRVIRDRKIRYKNNSYLVNETDTGDYIVDLNRPIHSPIDLLSDDEVVGKAFDILLQRHNDRPTQYLESPQAVKDLFRLHNTGRTTEAFSVAYLNNRHCLLSLEVAFVGGATSCSVYPEVIARRCLELHAKAAICGHNHPSNISAEPSRSDVQLTQKLKKVLSVVDVRLLDSIVTIDGNAVSLAERGEM